MIALTRTNCTAPQKHVAVASSCVDQPSFERLTTEKPLSSKVFILPAMLGLFAERFPLECKR